MLLIFLGGGIGSVLRFLLSTWIAERAESFFPWGTLAVNALGSFLIGAIFAMVRPSSPLLLPNELGLFLMMGVMGGFTTFSSFSLQTLTLVSDGRYAWAFFNVAGSVVFCLVACWLGIVATAAVLGR